MWWYKIWLGLKAKQKGARIVDNREKSIKLIFNAEGIAQVKGFKAQGLGKW